MSNSVTLISCQAEKNLNKKKGHEIEEKISFFQKETWHSYVCSEEWTQLKLIAVKKMLDLNNNGNYNFIIENFIYTETTDALS